MPVRIPSNLVGIEPDPAKIRIGMPVEVVGEDVTPLGHAADVPAGVI